MKEDLLEDKKEEKISLAAFIKENIALLTALGVFTALTIYTNNIPTFGPYLSFLSFSISVFIWFQLLILLPEREKESKLLSLFQTSLTLIFFYNVIYWIFYCKQVWVEMLFVTILLILLAIANYLLEKYNIYNKVFKKRNKAIKIVFVFIIYSICFFLSTYLYKWLNYALDILSKQTK